MRKEQDIEEVFFQERKNIGVRNNRNMSKLGIF